MVYDPTQVSAVQEKRSESNKQLSTSSTKRLRSNPAQSPVKSFYLSFDENPQPRQNPKPTTQKPIVTYRSRKRPKISHEKRIDEEVNDQSNLRQRELSTASSSPPLPQALNIEPGTPSSSSSTTRKTGFEEGSGEEVITRKKAVSKNRQSAPLLPSRPARKEPSFVLEIDSKAYSSQRSKLKFPRVEPKGKQKETPFVPSTDSMRSASLNKSNNAGNDGGDAMEDEFRSMRETGGRSPESDPDQQKPDSSLPIASTSQGLLGVQQQLPTPSPDVDVEIDVKPFKSSLELPTFASVFRPRSSITSQVELRRLTNVAARQQNAQPPTTPSINASSQARPDPVSSQAQNNAASPAVPTPAPIDSPSLASHLLSFDPDMSFAVRDSTTDLHLDFLAPVFTQLHFDTIQKIRRLKQRDIDVVMESLRAEYETSGSRQGIVEDLDWKRMRDRLYEGFGRH